MISQICSEGIKNSDIIDWIRTLGIAIGSGILLGIVDMLKHREVKPKVVTNEAK